MEIRASNSCPYSSIENDIIFKYCGKSNPIISIIAVVSGKIVLK
jgi:hypothetical protein